MKSLEAKKSNLYTVAEELYRRAELQLNTRIPSLFPEYTQHDIHHSIRIMETIEELVGDIDALNEFEIFLIIACSLLHDIGMAVDSSTVDCVKNDTSELTDIKFGAMVDKFSGDQDLALQELIRMLHGDISAAMIKEHYADLLVFKELGNVSFEEDVMQICQSHTKDHIWLNNNLEVGLVKSTYDYNPQYIAILLRLADILDFDGRRTPLFLYNIIRPRGASDKEWTQHFIVTNVEKVKLDRSSNLKKISIHGSCSDVELHRKFLGYVDWINDELEYAIETTATMPEHYRLFLKSRVELNIKSSGYSVSNYKLNIDFRAITNLLMGEMIYGERSLGLRELIQNGIDACKVRKEKEDLTRKFGDDPYVGNIKIIVDEDESSVVIRDNGSGMDEDIIKKYFLNIGRSYYTSDDYLLRRHKYKPIGNYGIGFLSCFMLSEKVTVRTSKPHDKYRFDIKLEKDSEYISFTRTENAAFSGTEVELDYVSFIKVLQDDSTTLEKFLRKYFINETVKISIVSVKERKEYDISSALNNMTASGSNEHLLDLSAQLKECNAFMVVKQKSVFIRKLEDISKVNEIVYWIDDHLTESTDLPISLFLDGNNFHFLNIPVYESGMESDFDTAYRLLEDIDDVIDKVEPDYWYSLIVKKDQQSLVYENELYDNNDDLIHENIYEHEFLEFIGIADGFIPKVFAGKEKIFGNSNKTLFISFQDETTHNQYLFLLGITESRVFLRDILIRNHNFNIPALPSCFEIRTLSVNILNQSIIPEVSRNRFDKRTTVMINYSLLKALILASISELDFVNDERSLLEEFVESKYSEPTLLIE